MEQVILVNEKDEETGIMEKSEAHRTGALHRAFSVIIYNSKGQMLLQRRSRYKYHSAGLWSNACCSHPRPGENIIDAAIRRLKEEMGITASLKEKGSFIYKAGLAGDIIEHELDYVLEGITDETPVLNKDEVADFKYVSVEELKADMSLHDDFYTFWFHEMARRGFF